MNRNNLFLLLLFFLGALSSCQKKPEDFREEGQSVIRTLIKDLQRIQSKEDLLKYRFELQKDFVAIVDVMIAARQYQQMHPEAQPLEMDQDNHELNEKLKIELNRMLEIRGAQEILEKTQELALHKLDAFEKKISKQK